jgi:hypothetical protein
MGCGGMMVVLSGACSVAVAVNTVWDKSYSSGMNLMLVETFGWIPVVAGVVLFAVGLRRNRRK